MRPRFYPVRLNGRFDDPARYVGKEARMLHEVEAAFQGGEAGMERPA